MSPLLINGNLNANSGCLTPEPTYLYVDCITERRIHVHMNTVKHFYSVMFTLFWDLRKNKWNFFHWHMHYFRKMALQYVEQFNDIKRCVINVHTKFERLRTEQSAENRAVMWTGLVMKRLHGDSGLKWDPEIEWALDSHIWQGRIFPPGRKLPKELLAWQIKFHVSS